MSIQDEHGSAGGEHAEAPPLRAEVTPKRVRALAAGTVVLDTRGAVMVWERPYYPTYYVPRADVTARLVETQERGEHVVHPDLGRPLVCDVEVGGRTLRGAALAFPDAADDRLRRLVRPRWGAMAEWLEEDEPVYVHPRDPYKRIDILASSRHVEVVVDGEVVADSTQPRILFETGLVPRYYLPITDVRSDVLRPSDSLTRCPYKGTAEWWSVHVGDTLHRDLAWTYRAPTHESLKIAGLVAFYDERVALHLDGTLQAQPRTPFA